MGSAAGLSSPGLIGGPRICGYQGTLRRIPSPCSHPLWIGEGDRLLGCEGVQLLVQMVYRKGLCTHLCGEPLLSDRVDDLWSPTSTDCDTSVCTAITCNNALSHSFAVE